MTRALFFFLLSLAGFSEEVVPPALRICFHAHPTTIDPRKTADFPSSTLISLLFEGLTRCTDGGKVEPALAESYELLDHKTRYRFYLRQAVWSDGRPITAYDFEASWKGAISLPCGSTFLFYPIQNVKECVQGTKTIDEVGIRALDAKTLEVKLEKPTPYFYQLTAFPSFLPVAAHAPDDPSICSGPYRLERMVLNHEITLSKNPRYWNEKLIEIQTLQIAILPDEMTALQMFEQNLLDWLGGPLSPLPIDALPKISSKLQFLSCLASTFCAFNTQSFPFSNLSLRKAFSYAIDRKEIAEQILQAGQTPPVSLLPPPFSQRNVIFDDPFASRLYLAKALQELGLDSEKQLSITLLFKTGTLEKRIAQTLQRQWKEVLGISVQLAQTDGKTQIAKLQQKNFQITLSSWIAQFDHPLSLLERFSNQENLKNYSGWQEERYQNLIERAKENPIFLAEAEEMLIEALPISPLYHWKAPFLISPRVEQIAATPTGGILFEKFKISCKK